MTQIIGILLAAGASRRFGADKLTQVLPNGQRVAVQACRNLMAGVDQVLAVLRPCNDELANVLRAEGARVEFCTEAEQGMGASLAFGIRVSSDADGWLVALADMPWIAPQTIVRVADALRSGASIVAPCLNGRRGHPVGFAKTLGSELTRLAGDAGAKNIIQAHLEQLCNVECDDAGILLDIDQPQDLPAGDR